MSVVGSETGMDARRVDADSSGARDGTARLSVRPLRGVELRLSEKRVSDTRAVGRRRAVNSWYTADMREEIRSMPHHAS